MFLCVVCNHDHSLQPSPHSHHPPYHLQPHAPAPRLTTTTSPPAIPTQSASSRASNGTHGLLEGSGKKAMGDLWNGEKK